MSEINSQKSTRLNRVTVFKLFMAIARKAGLPETLQHPHVLKHTTPMTMVHQGANAFSVRQHPALDQKQVERITEIVQGVGCCLSSPAVAEVSELR